MAKFWAIRRRTRPVMETSDDTSGSGIVVQSPVFVPDGLERDRVSH
jgi:hypothetical protein